MNELLDIEIILKRKEYSKIYNIGIIILSIIGIFIVIVFNYDYRTYLVTEARVIGNELELLISSDEIKYMIDNNYLMIDKNKYWYTVKRISNEVFQGEDGNTYQYIYIEVNNILKINNYIYQITVFKEEKKLIKYLVDYL